VSPLRFHSWKLTGIRSIAIDHLQDQFANETAKVIYIYFDYKSQQTQTGIDVLKGLLKQLLCQSQKVPPEVESLYTKSILEDTAPAISAFVPVLSSCSKDFACVYAVFDALDECSEAQQEEILSVLGHLQQFGYRFLISSRLHFRKLQKWLSDIRTLEISANDADLDNYVTVRLQQEGSSDILKAKCLQLMRNVKGM
jgi:hypothetical protein